jgi:hypothetical protein
MDADRNMHAHYCRPSASCKEWAENHIARIASVRNGPRDEHTQAVKDLVDSLAQTNEGRKLSRLQRVSYHFQGPLVLVHIPLC